MCGLQAKAKPSPPPQKKTKKIISRNTLISENYILYLYPSRSIRKWYSFLKAWNWCTLAWYNWHAKLYVFQRKIYSIFLGKSLNILVRPNLQYMLNKILPFRCFLFCLSDLSSNVQEPWETKRYISQQTVQEVLYEDMRMQCYLDLVVQGLDMGPQTI